MKKDLLKKVVASEVRSLLKEDARGIPEFAFREVSQTAIDGFKRHINGYILRMTSDPAKRRELSAVANSILEKAESDISAKLEELFQEFLRKS